MEKFLVNGTYCPPPSIFKWGLKDVSAPDAGRTEDALMHKNRVAQKRKIHLQWNGLAPHIVAEVLQMFNAQYFHVTYPDPMSGSAETREFYRSDPDADVYMWANGGLYKSITFDIIER